jgi:hypothetical protein
MKEGIMRKILITDNAEARNFSQKLYPRIIITRKEAESLVDGDVADVWLDGTDIEILERFASAKSRKYTEVPLDFSGDSDTIRNAVKQLKEYEPVVELPPVATIEDDFITGAIADSLPTESETPTLLEQHEIPMHEQIALLEPLLSGKRIGAGTIAELTAQLTDLCFTHKLFLRDTITGLFQSRFARRPLISESQAQTCFETHFVDKLAIKKISYKTDKETGGVSKQETYKPVSRADMDLLWRNVKIHSVFNSRKVFYDSIPKWDGEKRIETFMKKYYECDANPNFFLLLMTSIIGKIVSPEKNYCPYFFDIVCNSKGIGKSLLCRRLLGFKYCGFLPMTSRRDDFYVNAYDGNNVIVVDDECTWIGKGFDKITYDEFKSLVTNPVDKFSRKFQQPEEHDRCFVIMRTSNSVNTVFSTNERRQIVFECKLQENECRILNLPESFFRQMLAEAKAYYEAHGVYKLTEDDWKDVRDTNLDNFNWETEENFAILDYVKAVRSDVEKWGTKPLAAKFHKDKWGNYKKYCEWCNANHKKCLQNRAFWRNVAALAELPENFIAVLSESKYELAEGGKSRIFRVDPVMSLEQKKMEEIADIPY